jgi:hypothetical protein
LLIYPEESSTIYGGNEGKTFILIEGRVQSPALSNGVYCNLLRLSRFAPGLPRSFEFQKGGTALAERDPHSLILHVHDNL